LKLLPVSEDVETFLETLGRRGSASISLAIMSPNEQEWRGFSDVYYRMVKQTRLPWATYSKLANHLIDEGFVEKKTTTVNNRKAILIRLTDRGRQLVKMYVSLYGKQLEDLEPEEETPATRGSETE